jgi:hypothetical protein
LPALAEVLRLLAILLTSFYNQGFSLRSDMSSSWSSSHAVRLKLRPGGRPYVHRRRRAAPSLSIMDLGALTRVVGPELYRPAREP